MSARDEAVARLSRFMPRERAEALADSGAARIAAVFDEIRDQVRREDAAIARAAKLREPQGYDDERLNRALERVAVKIERGPE